MKKQILIILSFLFLVIFRINGQDRLIIENDSIIAKKINLSNDENGELSLNGASAPTTNVKNSDSRSSTNLGIGETPSSLSVSLTGGANYDIPIAVPPGINGIEPEISLNYNSQTGNGMAGYGWNINGISSITRIPSSKHHDGIIDAVDFDDLDRYALDGERLILKSGAYGTDGAVYETEKFSNLKIVSHGSNPITSISGPNYFIVHYPDGSKAKYGDGAGSSSHLGYSINYWENPKGVRISYKYQIDFNAQYIEKIAYGSLGTSNPINEIVFDYIFRERYDEMLINNINIKRSKILNKITCFSNNIKYREYDLEHSSNGRTELDYERLTAVMENSGDGLKSHSEIILEYSNTDSNVTYNDLTADLTLNNIEQRNARVLSLDANGNGKMDFAVYPEQQNKFWAFSNIQSQSSNFAYEYNIGSFEALLATKQLNYENKVLAGDGITIVQKGSGNQIRFKVYKQAPPSAGEVPFGYDYTKIWSAPMYPYQTSPENTIQKHIPREYISGDFDGDGLTDVLAFGKPYSSRHCSYHGDCDDVNPCDDDPVIIQDPNDDCLIRLQKNSGQFDKSMNIDSDSNTNQKIDKTLKISEPFDVETERNSNCNYSCYSYTSNYKSVYFINLRRDQPTGFTNYAGYLQEALSGDYKLYTGDFNGDGKTDIMHISETKYYVYTLDENNNLSLLIQRNNSGVNPADGVMIGDYNGDGKTDFLDPSSNGSSSFTVYLSTGDNFFSGSRSQPFTFRRTNWNPNNGVMSGYSLIPLDVNGDGKTDIVEYNTTTYNHYNLPWFPDPDGTQEIKIYKNMGASNSHSGSIMFEHAGTASKTGYLRHYPIPIYLTSGKKNKNLDFASISDDKITSFSFNHDHREDVLLKSIIQNNIAHEIEYSNLDSSIYGSEFNSQIYQGNHQQTYPNIDLQSALSTKVVTTLRRTMGIGNEQEHTKQFYFYRGAVYNAEGLGFLGFEAIAKSNWHTDYTNRIFTVSKYDANLRGAPIESYATDIFFSFVTPTSGYINKSSYQYNSSLSASGVFKRWMTSSLSQNGILGTHTNTTYQYDNYLNPTQVNTNFLGGSKLKINTYSNSTGSNYHIGRPTKVETTNTLGSESFTTEQQFNYSGYDLREIKTKGNGTPFDIETFEYDNFGNIKKKTLTPNGEASRIVETTYDLTGRFVIETKDIEGFIKTFDYDPDYGDWNLSKITNHFGHETEFDYDSWDRLIKVTDYRGNETTTQFQELNLNYKVTVASDDGSSTITEYDASKRVSVVKQKNLFGTWVSKKFEYDELDRLIRESEPYTGSPSQWNETTYDAYGRPTKIDLYTGRTINIGYNNLTITVNDGVKTVTTVKNQLGNVTSVTDPGGTINYSYFGNGNLKNTNYNGVNINIEQDGWGRKTKLMDPSAGTYEYEYNGYGEITKEINPKGTTIYEYDTTGKLIREDIAGDNTAMEMIYGYHGVNKQIETITLTSANGNDMDYLYHYDDDHRLFIIEERNSNMSFAKRFTFDNFDRIETEEYRALFYGNYNHSHEIIRYQYQNGGLKSIKDDATNANLWNAISGNSRGQLLKAELGQDVTNTYRYDTYGYRDGTRVYKGNGLAPNDVLMHLETDFDQQRGTLNSRSNSMFSWSETFNYDNLDRLMNFNDNDGNHSHDYDSRGRITDNDIIGDYNYTGNSYQLKDIDLNNQGNAYYQSHQLQKVQYNAFKQPFEVHEDGKERIGFQYNAFKSRSSMFYGDEEADIDQRKLQKHYSWDGSMEITYDKDNNTTTFVSYLGGDAYSAPAILKKEYNGTTSQEDIYYLHRDYLGSIMLITDGVGTVMEQRHFDAWGKAVKIADGQGNSLDKLTFLDRGYTGHEHLQGVDLIHMNGRLYDPKLRRFLSPDNYIQDTGNTQNFNRYAYVLNNPLMYIDPSGETGEHPGLTDGQQIGLGALISSIGAFVADNWDGIDRWATKNIFRPIQKMQPGKWIEGWFKKRDKPPVEYSNYQGLSSDPVAGTSASIASQDFVGSGKNGNLGISRGDTQQLWGPPSDAQKPDFSGFWGAAKYIWTGGHIDGVRYNKKGEILGLSPNMGVVEVGPGGKIIKLAKETRKVVVIGEDMLGRVIPYAKKYGYKYFKPRGKNPLNWMRNQVQWIRRQIKDPYTTIIDYGPKGPSPKSKYYIKELEIIKKWLNL